MRKLNNKTINDREHLMSPYHDQRSQISSKSKLISQANVRRFNENPDLERKEIIDYQKSKHTMKSVFSNNKDGLKRLGDPSNKSLVGSRVGSLKSKASGLLSRKSVVNAKEPSMKSTKSKMKTNAQKDETKDIDQVEVEVPLNTEGDQILAENPKVDIENIEDSEQVEKDEDKDRLTSVSQ
jgi:hypothetical protein